VRESKPHLKEYEMASAPTQTGNGQLPPGFKSPFTLVTQTGTHDDLLAVVATLTGKTLLEVFGLAVTLGMRKFNYHVDDALAKKLLFSLSNLTIGPWTEFASIAAMPDVAILLIDYDASSETGRSVVFHHVKGTQQQPAFHYILDVSNTTDPKLRVTTSFAHLNMKNAWYLEVTQRPNPAGNGKGK
jgi:hypothetical protein